ncbi:MAG: gliding motility-associated C-terminal domain-containing protein, partial [Bacteroidota bacterium]
PETGLNLDDPSNPIATLTEDQLYMVTITDPTTGCSDELEVQVIVYPDIALESAGGINLCVIEPIELTASAAIPVEFEWFFEEVSIGTGASITVTPPGEGCHTYTVVATDLETGCTQESQEVICVMDFTTALPDDPIVVCADEPTPINPNGDPNLIYEWTPMDEFIDLTEPWNPIVTTNMPLTYFLTVMDTTFGCTAMDTVNIEISPELNLEINPESVILCDSIPTTLTANTDVPPASITWFLLPDDIEIGTGVEITFTPPGGENQVYAVATSAAGCTESDTINVNNVPIDASITGELVICEATDAEVIEVINNNPEQELTVLWEELGVLTALDELIVTVDPNITNEFSATVTNQYNCSETLTTTVTVVDLLNDLSITADPDTILLEETSTITVSGCVGCDYDWDPFNEDENSPVFVFMPTSSDEVGLNEFFVTVDLLGCSLSLMDSVYVIDSTCDADHVFFPNAFTPNRDGENDILRLRSSFLDELTDMELLIYNRWGEEMFRTTNQYEGWDGTYRNEDLAPDVYGYYLRVVCPNGDELVQKGNVTLLR